MSGERFVLDTSALLAFMTGEKGADAIEKILADEENCVFIPWAGLFEVSYIRRRTGGEKEADRRFVLIKELPVSILWNMEEPDVISAARIKAQYRVSFADSIIAATALRQDGTFVHKDPEYECLSGMIKLRSLSS
ncbi:MAG: PIN domain-containing protein [Candidatus Aminicenantales bacterium]